MFLVAYGLWCALLGSGWLLLLIALVGGPPWLTGSVIAPAFRTKSCKRPAQRHQHAHDVSLRGLVLAGRGAGWLQQLAAWLPLSQIITAARAVMLEGAGWAEVAAPLGWVVLFTLLVSPWAAPCLNGIANETTSGSGGRPGPAVTEHTASADAMRCKNASSQRGQHRRDAVKCGEPMLRETLTRNEVNQFGNLVQVTTVSAGPTTLARMPSCVS